MGFWQGVNEGVTYALDKKQREKELEDERAYRKSEKEDDIRLRNQMALQDRITAAIPLLVQRRATDVTAAKNRAALGSFFENRMTDVDPETRTAFTNLAIRDTEYAAELIKGISGLENGDLKRKVTGQEILQIADIIEQTRSEDMSREDWIKEAAKGLSTSGSKIDFDATLTRLLSGDLTDKDLVQIQMDLATPSETGLGILPDFDFSVVRGPDIDRRNKTMQVVVDMATKRFQEDSANVDREYKEATKDGGMPSDELNARNMILGGIRNIADKDEREAALFNYYAPDILPQLAQSNPEIKTYFPEAFPSPAASTGAGTVKAYTRDEINRIVGGQQ